MDPTLLADGFARLADPDRLGVLVALTLGVAALGAALPWPRPRPPRRRPQPALRLRRPDLPWRLASQGPVEVPSNGRWMRRR